MSPLLIGRAEEDRLDYLENFPLQLLEARDLQLLAPYLVIAGGLALGLWLLRQ